MAHINELIDYTVVTYIVFKNKVLLVSHKRYNKWLPIGGHIELDEDPEEAAIREAKEESGLDIEIVGEKPDISDLDNKILFRPEYLHIHKVKGQHRHIVIVYFAKARSSSIILAEAEHHKIGWFSLKDLNTRKLNLDPAIKLYAEKALEKLKT